MAAPYERLLAWQFCHQLVLAVHRVTARFPTSERYGLTSQARRAAFSAAVNIVEGSAKRGKREFRRFLDIALGSLNEVEYIIRLACELGILGEPEGGKLEELHRQASRTTWKLYTSMSDRPQKPAA